MEEGDFEKTLNQLETLVTSLESGHLSLADAIEAFETGMALLRQAEALLKDAQQRVEVWTAQGEQPQVIAETNQCTSS